MLNLFFAGFTCMPMLALGVEQATKPMEQKPLEQAWIYAGSITNDVRDQQRCREQVIREMIAQGQLESAAHYVENLEGWRKWSATAALAEAYLKVGYTNQAIIASQKVEYSLPGLEGWSYMQVLKDCMRVKALLGDREYFSSLTNVYAGNEKLSGLAQAGMALVFSEEGRVGEALVELEQSAQANDYDVVLAAVEYTTFLLARQPEVTIRDEFIQRAINMARVLSGNRGVELEIELVSTLGARCSPETQSRLVRELDDRMASSSFPDHIQGPLWANAGMAFARNNDTARASNAFKQALSLSEKLSLIEQPFVLAAVAEGVAMIGQHQEAAELLSRAHIVASELVNPRPRFLALAWTMMASARSGITVETDFANGIDENRKEMHVKNPQP